MPKLAQRVDIPAGEYIFGPVQAPAPVNWIELRLDRNSWPDTGSNVVAISIQVSEDNITYRELGAITAGGGTFQQRPPYTGQRVNCVPALPMGTWARAVVTATETLDTRAIVLWG